MNVAEVFVLVHERAAVEVMTSSTLDLSCAFPDADNGFYQLLHFGARTAKEMLVRLFVYEECP